MKATLTDQQRNSAYRAMVCLWVFLWLLPFSAVAQEQRDLSKIPSRPYDHIMDDGRWLKVQEREKIQEEFSRRFIEQQIDLYLVILPEEPAPGVETYARVLGEAWSRAPVWCVIVHIAGDPDGVYAQAGGAEIAQPRFDKAVAEALKRAKRESTEKERVLAACVECPNDLRFVLASHQRQNERVAEKVDQIIDKRISKDQKLKFLAIGSGLCLILLGILIYLIIKVLKNRKRQFVFPDTVWRERFLGPHSGGGGINVNYK